MTPTSDLEFEQRLRRTLHDWAAEAPLSDGEPAEGIRLAPGLVGRRARPWSRGAAWLAAAAAVVAAVVGAIVVARDDQASVSVVDVDGATTIDRIEAGTAGVRSLAVGSDRILLTSALDERLFVIDPSTAKVVDETPIPSHVEGIAALDDGDVLLGRFTPDEVIRVDVSTGAVRARAEFASQPAFVPAFGVVWVVDDTASGGVLHRLDPHTLTEQASFPLGHPAGFVAAGHAALWVASATDASVVRVDARTGTVTEVAGTSGLAGQARAIAVDGAGAVWATVGDSIVKIDPDRAVVTDVVPVGRRPHSIAVDGDHVWVSNFDDGTVSRIDAAASPPAVTTYVAGLRPGAIVAGFGSVWISLHQEATVLRVGARAGLPAAVEPDVARSIDAGAGAVYVRCSGRRVAGRPTVVLEPDLDVGIAGFGSVEAALASDGRVCAVDRDLDRSTADESALARSAADLASDHREALAAIGEAGPFLVVGERTGGITAQLFAHRYPGDVAGLVLLDPLPVDWFDHVRPLLSAGDRQALDRSLLDDPGLAAVAASMTELRAAVLGDLPLTVVSPDPARLAGGASSAIVELLGRLHEELARSSARGEMTVARGSGHAIAKEQPSVVLEAVDRTMARIGPG